MSDSITCFLSYCYEDVDKDAVRYLLDYFKEYNDKLNVLYDGDIDYGRSFKEFMDEIETVNGAIVLFSPNYKKKALNRKNGVYYELKQIKRRYDNERARRRRGEVNNKNFVLIPILFSGSLDDSIPPGFEDLKYIDMTSFNVFKNKSNEICIGDNDRRKYHCLFNKIADQLLMIKAYDSKKYIDIRKKLHEKLFRNLKSDWGLLDEENIQWHKHAFVKTNAFEKMKKQSACLLIGRKGSGKSTITKFLAYQSKEKYKEHDPIIVDKLQLEYIFTIFESPKVANDIKHIFTISKSYSFAWELYLYLYCINVIIKEYLKGRISAERGQYVFPLKKYMLNMLGDERFDNFLKSSASFIFCLTCLNDFIDKCIYEARNEKKYFYTDILTKFTFENFLLFGLTEDVLTNFERIIEKCTKKFLVSLDGFDQSFDEYRKSTVENYKDEKDIKRRTNNEINWLTTFLNTVLRIKSNHDQKTLYSLIDFCVAVPTDRFLEIRKKERDSYIYSGRYATLRWSGPELIILLRKRLELLSGYYCERKKDKNPHELLQEVMENGFNDLITDTVINIGKMEYPKHIFLEVLRHTFWRPRDILWYFRNILAMHSEMSRRNKKITVDQVKKIISDTTFRVIDAEFIGEFQKSLVNIRNVISAFNQSDNILSYEQIQQKIYDIDFYFAYGKDENLSLNEKIEYLYNLGFLGIVADKNFVNRFGLRSNHVFYFNEGSQMFKGQGMEESELKMLNYLIHPMFCEYLNLNVNEKTLIFNYTWDYLYETEAYIFTYE